MFINRMNKQNHRRLQTFDEIRFLSCRVQYRRSKMNTLVKRAKSTAFGQNVKPEPLPYQTRENTFSTKTDHTPSVLSVLGFHYQVIKKK